MWSITMVSLRGILIPTLRVIFSLERLASVSPAYEYFMACLENEYSTGTGKKIVFEAKQIPTNDLPQHLDFKRTKEMVSEYFMVCCTVISLRGKKQEWSNSNKLEVDIS